MDKIGRNDPCPCGSGKKYKRCCLASPAKDGLAGGFTAEERHSALAKLERFVESKLGPEDEEAYESFYARWQDRFDEIEQMEGHWMGLSESYYDMWFFVDYTLPAGGRVADLFLARNSQLSPGERRYIDALRQTAVRLYEVEVLTPGISVTLRDVLTGTRTTVSERLGSRSLSTHDLVAARINNRSPSGMPEIEPELLHLPELIREPVVSELLADLERYRRMRPDSPETEFFKEMAPFFHDAWMSCVLDPPVPHLKNMDGEDLLITRVRFDVTAPDDLARALDRGKELEREEGETVWCWVGPGTEGQEIVLGKVVLQGEQLDLECMSAERGERGRALIEKLAAGLVHHRATMHENLAMEVRDRLRAGRGRERSCAAETSEDLPREVQEALVLDQMVRYYRDWLDKPVRALEGRTPREAAADVALRSKLIDLIRGLEGQYQRALQAGTPAYDPSWMWTELQLQEGDGPAHPPPLAHERMATMTPGLGELCRRVAEQARRRPGFNDVSTILTAEELRTNLEIQRFLRDREQPADGEVRLAGSRAPAEDMTAHLRFMTNFELHRRKTFWVDESLAYMLAKTDLDVPGRDVRVPFPCFALVFTDRQTLSLAERMLSKDRECPLAGHFLRVAAVYVIEEHFEGSRVLRVGLALDALGADPPHLVVHEIPLAEDKQVGRFFDDLAPPVVLGPPLPDAHPLRALLHLTLNAILYATSAGVAPELRPKPDAARIGFQLPEADPLRLSSEDVYFLPGKIEISQLRNFQELERVESGRRLLHRFMVRGHWRRAAARWKDQRVRWIKPYWKGPDMAAVIERAYRLKP